MFSNTFVCLHLRAFLWTLTQMSSRWKWHNSEKFLDALFGITPHAFVFCFTSLQKNNSIPTVSMSCSWPSSGSKLFCLRQPLLCSVLGPYSSLCLPIGVNTASSWSCPTHQILHLSQRAHECRMWLAKYWGSVSKCSMLIANMFMIMVSSFAICGHSHLCDHSTSFLASMGD